MSYPESSSMQKIFMTTEDGSHTIYLPEMDEHYHSTHGAINESLHVYIEQGLLSATVKNLSVLEIGFGTGLNAFLTFGYALQRGLKVDYYSIEKYPLQSEEYALLNYPEQVFKEHSKVFNKLHEADWNKPVALADNFKLHKLQADLLHFQFEQIPSIDLVYYDAFAPGKQPEMWTEDILHKVAHCVKPGGLFLTYCSKGTVRRALADAGFTMERIPGPTGKKEILRGKKSG